MDSDRCQHCRINKGHKPRRLCSTCYYHLEIRNLYAAGRCCRPKSYRGVGTTDPSLPPTPTKAAPGSLAKLAELGRRAEMGLNLWHPADAKDVD